MICPTLIILGLVLCWLCSPPIHETEERLARWLLRDAAGWRARTDKKAAWRDPWGVEEET